jgi:hypothetical protein
MIGDRYAMGVATQIAQHLHGATESRFGVDYPVVTMQSTEKLCELLSIRDRSCRTRALQLLAAVEAFQAGEELATKDTTQNPDG